LSFCAGQTPDQDQLLPHVAYYLHLNPLFRTSDKGMESRPRAKTEQRTERTSTYYQAQSRRCVSERGSCKTDPDTGNKRQAGQNLSSGVHHDRRGTMLVPVVRVSPLQDRLRRGDVGLSFGAENVLAASLLNEPRGSGPLELFSSGVGWRGVQGEDNSELGRTWVNRQTELTISHDHVRSSMEYSPKPR